MNYSIFIMDMKEMMPMEAKVQLVAAPATSPLLSSQSTDPFCVFFVSMPPSHKITKGGIYSRF
jgi:hypothetical protein